ncbi:MAG: hypothetical protein M0P70_13195 [Desulfobulbaceae bacterium]|nr:hypothetical protein [Desulfobulbaceae bacterium]
MNLGNILKEFGYLNEAIANWELSLRYKEDWQEALKRLTNPLLIDSDLVRGPQYPIAFTEDQTRSQKHIIKLPLESSYAKLLDKKYLISSDRHATSSEKTCFDNAAQRASKKLRIVLIYPPPLANTICWPEYTKRYAFWSTL